MEEEHNQPIFQVDDTIRQVQVEKLKALRAERDDAKVSEALQWLESCATGEENIMPAVIQAVESLSTLGEIADTLRKVYGEYQH